MEKETQIIGTFHMDLASPQIMQKILDEVKPDILVGESNELLDLKSEIRDMVWMTLFDQLDIDEETQRMFYAMEPDKEHTISKQYAHRNKIDYYMLDIPEELDHGIASTFARKSIVKTLKESPEEEAISMIKSLIRQNYARHLKAQDNNPPCVRLYNTDDILNSTSPQWVAERDPHMAKELIKIMDENPDKSILGFFGLIHIVDRGPFKNMRYHLRDKNVKFSKLIDWV